ncbi:MAG TPA: fumarylacetoacetate hydrolase family protein [Casimicrobiaceae bacterium]|nr:fumarylacetoacetate hydrolase family protein [Casimicrobiaceae bacterium]
MRLLSFEHDGRPTVGLLVGSDVVLPLRNAGGEPPFDPDSMLALIAAGAQGLAWLRSHSTGPTVSLRGLRLLAPIPRPTKNVFCVGWNYLEHFKEGEKNRPAPVDLPEHPVFFTKAPTSVNGPYDAIPYDGAVTEKLDWEVELGVVIGKRGRNIAERDALDYVWGYTVINDVTGRDLQRRHGNQWFKGKSLDGCAPMGPWIATADEIDPSDLHLICRVNGVVKQDSSTRYMYFRIPRLIEELSLGMTLEPGDIIATGTPAGVGHARTPPEFLRPTDVLETEIEGLGVLRNRIG